MKFLSRPCRAFLYRPFRITLLGQVQRRVDEDLEKRFSRQKSRGPSALGAEGEIKDARTMSPASTISVAVFRVRRIFSTRSAADETEVFIQAVPEILAVEQSRCGVPLITASSHRDLRWLICRPPKTREPQQAGFLPLLEARAALSASTSSVANRRFPRSAQREAKQASCRSSLLVSR